MKKSVVAVVPAAGLGRRFGTNKTYETLRGRPLLLWALETLSSLSEVTEIIPVIKEADMEQTLELLERNAVKKVRKIAPGGRERQDSVFHGLSLIDDRSCTVLIHDGVRPLIEPSVIVNALDTAAGCDGVVVAVPVKDTIKEASEGCVKKTLDRSILWAVQTPQIFPYETIYGAYRKAMSEGFYSTDDSALVERYGGTVRISMGSYTNIKITTRDDLVMADAFLGLKREEG